MFSAATMRSAIGAFALLLLMSTMSPDADAASCEATFGAPTTIETITPADSGRQYLFDLVPGQTKAFAFNLPATANSYGNSIGWSTFETNNSLMGAAHEIAFSPCPNDFNYVNAAGQQCHFVALDNTGANARIAATDVPGACMMPVGTLYMNVRFTNLAGTNTCGAGSNGYATCQQWNNMVMPTPGPWQAIAFPAIPAHQLGDAPFTLFASGGGSGNPVAFTSHTPTVCSTTGANGASLAVLAPGSCRIEATQSGDGTYEPAAPVWRDFSVVDPVAAQSDFPSSFDGCTSTGAGCTITDDVTWQRGDGGFATTLLDANGQPRSSALLIGGGTGWSIKLEADFNGDGNVDLLWRHNDGRVAIWLMNGSTQIGGASLIQPWSGWSPEQVGDFDGDGKADILWVHTDGRSEIWLMNGTARLTSAGLIGAGTGWLPRAVGDFNADGKADILWVHGDGRMASWLMNGTTQVGGALLLGAGTGWTPRLLGDFNGDARTDLLLQHTDGRTAVWLLSGASVLQTATLLPAGTGWFAARVGYWNEDAKADIVWQKTDGSIAVWTMDGVTQTGGALLVGSATGYRAVRFLTAAGPALHAQRLLLLRSDGSLRLYQPGGFAETSGPGTGWVPFP